MMFRDLITFPIEHPRLAWEARQALRDFKGKPHLFLRLRLTGAQFPHRALEPFVQIGRTRSVFVEIAADELSARAYFDQLPPGDTIVEFGYEDEALLRFPRRFVRSDATRLDRRRLPRGTANIDRFFGKQAE